MKFKDPLWSSRATLGHLLTRLIIVISAAAASAAVVIAAPVVIDDFSSDQAALSLTFPADPVGSSTSSTASGGGIVGGERDLEIVMTGATVAGGISAGVATNALSYGQDPTIVGTGSVQWDGADGDATTLDPTGLGGVDLTNGGSQDALAINIIALDLAADITLTVYTDGANASSFALSLPGGIFLPEDLVIPYSSFTTTLGAGADFTNAGAITVDTGSVLPIDLALGPVTSTALVTATKTDALLVDNGTPGVVNPGDTVRYTVVIENPDDSLDAAATGVAFATSVDVNTALVVGSVTTSQGTVTIGNTAGDTSVAVDIGTVTDGAAVTISFDVMVDDPLPAGIMEILCQGLVTSDSLTDVLTDDPDDAASDDDPTRTPIEAAPSIEASKADIVLVDVDMDGLADAGDTLKYTVVLTNSGNMAGAGVMYSNPAVANTTLVVGSVTTSQGTVTSGNTAGDTSVTVDIGAAVGGGGSVMIMFEVVIDNPLAMGVTEIACQGTVTGDNFTDEPTDDPDSLADDDETLTPIDFDPLIEATKADVLVADSDMDGLVDPGDTVGYTVVISNSGLEDAMSVIYSGPAVANTALVVGSVTTTQGSVSSGNTAGDSTVGVDVGILGVGGSVTITFEVIVDEPIAAGVTEIACQGTVTGGNFSDEPTDDPDTPADDDETLTPVDRDPEFVADKTALLTGDVNDDGFVGPGDTVQYTVAITNIGDGDATGVVFDDTPDANTTLVVGSVVTSQGVVTLGNSAGDTAISIDIGTLVAAATVTIVYDVTVNDPLPDGVEEILNQGVVSSVELPDFPTDDPNDPTGDDDPTGVPVGGPVQVIPTLDLWGLVLLILIMSGLAVLRLRRA